MCQEWFIPSLKESFVSKNGRFCIVLRIPLAQNGASRPVTPTILALKSDFQSLFFAFSDADIEFL